MEKPENTQNNTVDWSGTPDCVATYTVSGITKFAEQDKFASGCLPDTAQMDHIDASFSFVELEDLIKAICRMLNVDVYDINPCEDDPSRIDFHSFEDDDGHPMNIHGRNLWMANQKRGWSARYSVYVRKSVPVDISQVKLLRVLQG